MESAVLSHPIRDQKTFAFFNLLNNFDIGLTLSATFLLSIVGILSLAILINELTHRIRFERSFRSENRRTANARKGIALAVSIFNVKRCSAIGIFFLFVQLFFWMTELFLGNNIKTNQVVRDCLQPAIEAKISE